MATGPNHLISWASYLGSGWFLGISYPGVHVKPDNPIAGCQKATALEMLAKQQTQMRTAIYQNQLALDYTLAKEGGVCGKFNLSNCCLNIDDNGQAVMDIPEGIRKLAHVPV